ncbi:protein of unknown function [Legionella fallonii LLAP-10]|uniref:Uncharacterized protein n=1 Tax=Legionella fallonii LLAP-10 TaxID=1212491 RepID=A0A098G2V0_9GAMM|nr:protein of unknown function [Legionella fallonii LLAP-10]
MELSTCVARYCFVEQTKVSVSIGYSVAEEVNQLTTYVPLRLKTLTEFVIKNKTGHSRLIKVSF